MCLNLVLDVANGSALMDFAHLIFAKVSRERMADVHMLILQLGVLS